jgi:hypothetical protein
MNLEALLKIIREQDARIFALEKKVFPLPKPGKCPHGHRRSYTKTGKIVCHVCDRRQAAKRYDKLTLEKNTKALNDLETQLKEQPHFEDGGN